MNVTMSKHGEQSVSSGFRVDISRGQRIGRVSSEWFARPDDERYLNLPDLYDAVRSRAERAQVRTVESRTIRVEAVHENAERLALIVAGQTEPVTPTHWSFGQLCTLFGAPAAYLRNCPPDGIRFLARQHLCDTPQPPSSTIGAPGRDRDTAISGYK